MKESVRERSYIYFPEDDITWKSICEFYDNVNFKLKELETLGCFGIRVDIDYDNYDHDDFGNSSYYRINSADIEYSRYLTDEEIKKIAADKLKVEKAALAFENAQKERKRKEDLKLLAELKAKYE